MNDRETQALAAAAAAYENRTDQLRISDEEMAGQLTMDASGPWRNGVDPWAIRKRCAPEGAEIAPFTSPLPPSAAAS